MKKVKLEILGLSPGQSQSGSSFAVILGEEDGKRRLPIIIGMFEAQSIAIELEKITPSRPMTHDLFKTFAKHCHFTLKEILISDLKEGVFFAKIVAQQQNNIFEIDARPSDAIALALRFDIDMYIYDYILEDVGIPLEDIEEDNTPEKEPDMDLKEKVKTLKVQALQKILKEAIANEAYEDAAFIRDELRQRGFKEQGTNEGGIMQAPPKKD